LLLYRNKIAHATEKPPYYLDDYRGYGRFSIWV
jgi:hypothetical protein